VNDSEEGAAMLFVASLLVGLRCSAITLVAFAPRGLNNVRPSLSRFRRFASFVYVFSRRSTLALRCSLVLIGLCPKECGVPRGGAFLEISPQKRHVSKICNGRDVRTVWNGRGVRRALVRFARSSVWPRSSFWAL